MTEPSEIEALIEDAELQAKVEAHRYTGAIIRRLIAALREAQAERLGDKLAHDCGFSAGEALSNWRIEAMEAELARLREALEPFGQLAERYEKLRDDYPLWAVKLSHQEFAERDKPPIITIGHFRRARAALTGSVNDN